MIRGLAKNLAGYGAAPTSVRTPSFIGANAPDDPYDPNTPPPDDADSDPGGGNDVAPPQNPQPLPLNRLDQPPPKAADLAPPPARVMTAREKLAQMNDPDALPKTSVKRQLGAAALSLIPGVNMTDIPRNVAYPGISDYTRRRQALQQQVQLEHQGTQEDLTRLQRDTQRENVESLREARSGNMQTRQSDERRKEAGDITKQGGIPINDANLPPGMAPLLSPEDEGKYFTKQVNGQWYKVPTPEERQRQATAQKKELLDAKAEGKPPGNLRPEHFTDETTGDVTTIWYDPTTGSEAKRSVAKGVARKRPQVNQNNITIPGMPAAAAAGSAPGSVPAGEDYLKTLPPGIGNQVRQIINGDMQMPSGSTRSASAQQIRQAVNQADPTFNEQRFKTKSSYKAVSPATPGGSINSANTVINHIGLLNDLAEAMSNGDVQGVNRAVNWVKTQLGNPNVTNANAAMTAVSNEMERLMRQAGTSDSGIAAFRSAIDVIRTSPAQAKGQIGTLLQILGGRTSELANSYVRAMDRGDNEVDRRFVGNFISPQARKTLTRLGVKPESLLGMDSGGAAPPAATGSGQQPNTAAPSNPNPNGYVVGHVYGGMTYLGGEPKNQASWKK